MVFEFLGSLVKGSWLTVGQTEGLSLPGRCDQQRIAASRCDRQRIAAAQSHPTLPEQFGQGRRQNRDTSTPNMTTTIPYTMGWWSLFWSQMMFEFLGSLVKGSWLPACPAD